MKKIILTTVLVILGTILIAQNKVDSADTRPLNDININLLGDASLISVNYERLFFINSTFFITGKLGLGYNQEFQLCLFGPCSSPPKNYTTIPHHITGNLGKGRSFFEFGLGGTIINGNTDQHYLLYPIVGYRFLPLNSGKVIFRIFGNIPFIGRSNIEDILFFPLGLNLGVSF